MPDTYQSTVSIASVARHGVTLTVARTAGASCDEIELIYKNRHTFHLFRHYNIFDLWRHLSTIPDGITPPSCVCVQAVEEEVVADA